MSWNTITTDEVLNELTPIEQATLENIQGATTNLGDILTGTVNRVRGMVKAGGNQVDQANTGTIPDQLRQEVIAIARWRWLISFPALKSLKTTERGQAAKDAEALMKEISSMSPSRPRVELPAGVDVTPTPMTQPSTAPRHRRWTMRDQEGL